MSWKVKFLEAKNFHTGRSYFQPRSICLRSYDKIHEENSTNKWEREAWVTWNTYSVCFIKVRCSWSWTLNWTRVIKMHLSAIFIYSGCNWTSTKTQVAVFSHYQLERIFHTQILFGIVLKRNLLRMLSCIIPRFSRSEKVYQAYFKKNNSQRKKTKNNKQQKQI